MKKLITFIILILLTMPIVAEQFTKTDAEILCRDYYKELYTSQTGLKAKSSMWKHNANVREYDTFWSVGLYGEVQNYYGTWIRVLAACEIYKQTDFDWYDYRNIKHFEYVGIQ